MDFDPLSIVSLIGLLFVVVVAARRQARPARQETWLHKMEARRADSRGDGTGVGSRF